MSKLSFTVSWALAPQLWFAPCPRLSCLGNKCLPGFRGTRISWASWKSQSPVLLPGRDSVGLGEGDVETARFNKHSK